MSVLVLARSMTAGKIYLPGTITQIVVLATKILQTKTKKLFNTCINDDNNNDDDYMYMRCIQ